MSTPASVHPAAARTAYDVRRVREDFPILSRRIYGKPLVYLDNAATTQKPRAVLDAVRALYTESYANIHRGVHRLSVESSEAYEKSRERMRDFLHAGDTREIVFVRGTTEGINLVAQTYGRANVQAGDEVLISALEHHSNIVPWQILCGEKGAKLVVAPINERGEIRMDELEKRLSKKTKMVAVSHVSNALGTVNPIRKIIVLAHERGAPVLVDGAQAAPRLPVDVRELDCDFYTLSGHKMYGPTGVGILYGKAKHLEAMPPYQGGGDMISSVTFEKTTYNILPYKFEAGTPNIAGALGLAAAADYMNALGIENIEAHENDLLSYGTERLSEVPGLRIIGTAREKAAVLSFTLEGIHPHDVGTVLDREGVAVRTGHHCAQPVMDFFQVPATSRASFALYNTREEVDVLVAGIHRVVEMFPPMSDDLRDLYQEVILDHSKRPRNFKPLPAANRSAEGYNPLCGDKETIYLKVEGDVLKDVSFQGSGCAISTASASMMTERVKGMTQKQAEALFEKFHDLITSASGPRDGGPDLEKLEVFSGVREYPVRIKCATLPWHTLKAALRGEQEPISTELSEGPKAESGGA